MTYETASEIAQQGGSVYFLLLFLGACAYALWPRNADTFKRAARAALTQDDADDHPL